MAEMAAAQVGTDTRNDNEDDDDDAIQDSLPTPMQMHRTVLAMPVLEILILTALRLAQTEITCSPNLTRKIQVTMDDDDSDDEGSDSDSLKTQLLRMMMMNLTMMNLSCHALTIAIEQHHIQPSMSTNLLQALTERGHSFPDNSQTLPILFPRSHP